jgi:hypothetical protein
MPKAMMETGIARSADDVWARVRGFAELDWYPGIESCRLEGDMRIATMEGMGLECDELLVHYDDTARTYTYAVVGFRGKTQFDLGNGQVFDLDSMTNHHRARMDVLPVDDETCRVTYELELDPGHDEMFELTCGQYQGVIDHLKQLMER